MTSPRELDGAQTKPSFWIADKEARDPRDERHATDPQRGDYWQDMLCPAYVVLGRVGKNRVLVCSKTKPVDNDHWTWDFERGVELLTLSDFKKRISYETIPGYWCSVVPGLHAASVDDFEAESSVRLQEWPT